MACPAEGPTERGLTLVFRAGLPTGHGFRSPFLAAIGTEMVVFLPEPAATLLIAHLAHLPNR